MAVWPTLEEVRSLLRLQPDPTEDGIIGTALAAAIDWGQRRYGTVTVDNGDGTVTVDWKYPGDTTTLPDTGHEACLLHAARLYRRRDSIDGTISWGDLGAMRVGRVDPDVIGLYDASAPMVFG